ncbi:MAG: UbiX family flavin prenyltransferase [Planctomycetes bacterium]|nr:UbiX family flavin prenyltransferase [Planctomycetota bacterium]
MNHPICVGITGASGAIYAVRLLEVLRALGRDVHLSISPSGRDVIRHELNLHVDLDNFQVASLLLGDGLAPHDSKMSLLKTTAGISTSDRNELGSGPSRPGEIHYHHWHDFLAPMASGSFLTAGMVICPCSGTTLSAVATGAAGNLIQRAAEVHLKERRKLVLVPRETPLSLPHIDNMRRATEAGAIVLPASPGWYHDVRSVRDLVDFMVTRICDQLGIEHTLTKRWGGN